MPSTYDPIMSLTLGVNADSVTFNNIPATYTDLILVTSVRETSSSNSLQELIFRINSDSGGNYSLTNLVSNGSSASSGRRASGQTMAYIDYGRTQGNAGSGIFAVSITNIMSYSNTSVFKSMISRAGAITGTTITTRGSGFTANLWQSTAAISSITFISFGGGTLYSAGSTFSLYGVTAA
jgi:hypothetical protein